MEAEPGDMPFMDAMPAASKLLVAPPGGIELLAAPRRVLLRASQPVQAHQRRKKIREPLLQKRCVVQWISLSQVLVLSSRLLALRVLIGGMRHCRSNCPGCWEPCEAQAFWQGKHGVKGLLSSMFPIINRTPGVERLPEPMRSFVDRSRRTRVPPSFVVRRYVQALRRGVTDQLAHLKMQRPRNSPLSGLFAQEAPDDETYANGALPN